MEVPVDSLTHGEAPHEVVKLDESELSAWDDAWTRVEAHLAALGIRNKLILSRKVTEVMQRTERHWVRNRDLPPAHIAGEEIESMLTDWLRSVLELDSHQPPEAVSRRGRLALLLMNMPNEWQDAFLSDPPWPAGFAESLRQQYSLTGPEFSRAHMSARPLDLGPIPKVADVALRKLEKYPRFRSALIWSVLIGAFVVLFYISR